MKILFTVSHFFPSIGGLENHCLNLGKKLIEKQHKVDVFSSNLIGFKPTPFKKKFMIEGMNVYKFTPFSFLVPYAVPTRWTISFTPTMIPTFFRKVKDYSIIHSHGFAFFQSDLSALACSTSKKPFILTIHGFHPDIWKDDPVKEIKLMPYYKTIGQWTLEKAAAIIALTKHEKIILENNFNISSKKICIIPNGINLQKLNSLKNEIDQDQEKLLSELDFNEDVITYIGRISKDKGLQHLILSVPKILEEFPKTKFLFVGQDWGYKKELIRLAEKLGIKKHIYFFGRVSNKKIVKILSLSDVIVNPSRYEGFGIIFLEAMAFGKPIVATKVGGVPFIVEDGVTGILVDYGDSQSIFGAICQLLDNPNLKRKMGHKGQIKVKNYDWKIIAVEIEKLYKKFAN